MQKTICLFLLFSIHFFSFTEGFTQNNPSSRQVIADCKDKVLKDKALKEKGLLKIDALESCLATARKELGESDSLTALLLHEIGKIYYSGESYMDFKNAIAYWSESLSIRENIFPSNHTDIGRSYFALSLAYGLIGDDKNTLESIKKCIALRKENATVKDYVKALSQLGRAYRKQGDYPRAIENYQKALQHLKAHSSVNLSKETAGLHSEIGLAYYHQKIPEKLDSAITSQNRALVIYKKNREANERNIAGCYTNLANIYEEQEKYKNALTNYRQAINIYEQRKPSGQLVRTLNSFSYTLIKTKAFKEAKMTLRKAMDLGALLKNNYTLSASNENMGVVFFEQMQYDSALYYHHRAIRYIMPSFDNPNLMENPILSNINVPISSKSHLLIFLESKAKCLRAFNTKDRLVVALSTYKTMDTLLNLLHQEIKTESAKLQWRNNSNEVYKNGIETAYQLYLLTNEAGYRKDILAFSQKNKAAILLEAVSDRKAQQLFLPEQLLEKEQALSWQLANFEQSYIPEEEAENHYLDSIITYRNRYEAFVKQIEQTYPKYYEWKYQKKPLEIKELRVALLDTKTALLDFFVSEKHIYASVLTLDDFFVLQLPKADNFDKIITQLKQVLSKENDIPTTPGKNDFAVYGEAAHQTYVQLIAPIIGRLSPVIKKLIIIPDGKLNYIPFEALLTKEADISFTNYGNISDAWLINKYQITYAYSVALLLEKVEDTFSNTPFIGFAPSDYEQLKPSIQLEALLNNETAIQTIKKIMDGFIYTGKVYTKEAASKSNLLNIKENIPILHLSTHATVNDSFPLKSNIYLSDGSLTTSEIYNFPISTKLAVLSACETGTGQLQKGEGIMSLARSFMYAGCPSVVTSLWKVDNEKTNDLMYAFYKNLRRGQSKDEALHHAKLTYINNQTSDDLLNPKKWAAFIHIGNTEPLFSSSFSSKWLFLLGIGAIFCLVLWKRKKIKKVEISH